MERTEGIPLNQVLANYNHYYTCRILYYVIPA